MNTTRIPAGLTDLNMEIYLADGKIEFIKDGARHPFDSMDVDDLAIIRAEMDRNPHIDELFTLMGITDPTEQIYRWITCNFGDFDSRADISSSGVFIREYWDCGHRGSCQYEGRMCQLPCGPNGRLTPREIDVIKLVAKDLADKQIADRLCISTNTVCLHRSHIEHKIGAHSKAGITAFAYEHNIL